MAAASNCASSSKPRKEPAALASGETDAIILQSSGADPGLAYWPLFPMIDAAGEFPASAGAARVCAGRDLASETLILHDMPGGRLGVIDEFFVPARVYPSQVRRVQLTEAISRWSGRKWA